MKKDWILGFIGLWLIALAFSGFPVKIERILLIISGLIVAFISFRAVSSHKIEKTIANAGVDNQNKEGIQ